MSGWVTTWSLPTTACSQVTWKSVRALCSEAEQSFINFCALDRSRWCAEALASERTFPLTFPPTAKTCSPESTHLACAARASSGYPHGNQTSLQACLLERNQRLPGSRTGKIHKVEPGSASLFRLCRQLETWCLFRQSCPRNRRDARITYTQWRQGRYDALLRHLRIQQPHSSAPITAATILRKD